MTEAQTAASKAIIKALRKKGAKLKLGGGKVIEVNGAYIGYQIGVNHLRSPSWGRVKHEDRPLVIMVGPHRDKKQFRQKKEGFDWDVIADRIIQCVENEMASERSRKERHRREREMDRSVVRLKKAFPYLKKTNRVEVCQDRYEPSLQIQIDSLSEKDASAILSFLSPYAEKAAQPEASHGS